MSPTNDNFSRLLKTYQSIVSQPRTRDELIISIVWQINKELQKTHNQKKTPYLFGHYLKLTNLWHSPLRFISPKSHIKKFHGMSVSHLHWEILQLPKYGQIDLGKLYTEWVTLCEQALQKNRDQMDGLYRLFVQTLWKSDIFERNPHLTNKMDFFEQFIERLKVDKNYQTLNDPQEKLEYVMKQIFQFPSLDDVIKQNLHQISQNPRKLRKLFDYYHTNLKRDYERFGTLIGLVRGASDILNDTFEENLEDYINQQPVWYGVNRFHNKSTTSPKGGLPLTNTLVENYPLLLDFLNSFLCDTLRKIRNAESHPKIDLRQEKLDEMRFIIHNEKENYYEEFTLGEIWKMHEALYLILTYFFNLYFYLLPSDQIKPTIVKLLEIQNFDPGFGLDDLQIETFGDHCPSNTGRSI